MLKKFISFSPFFEVTLNPLSCLLSLHNNEKLIFNLFLNVIAQDFKCEGEMISADEYNFFFGVWKIFKFESHMRMYFRRTKRLMQWLWVIISFHSEFVVFVQWKSKYVKKKKCEKYILFRIWGVLRRRLKVMIELEERFKFA